MARPRHRAAFPWRLFKFHHSSYCSHVVRANLNLRTSDSHWQWADPRRPLAPMARMITDSLSHESMIVPPASES